MTTPTSGSPRTMSTPPHAHESHDDSMQDIQAPFTPAFSHNAALLDANRGQHDQDLPNFTFRKASEAGLHLQTDMAAGVSEQSGGSSASKTANSSGSRSGFAGRPPPLARTDSGQLLATRATWGSGTASPGSVPSSPAMGTLSDVTALPSPVNPSSSADAWRRVAGRPHSGSSASIERERMAGQLLFRSESASKKKKPYGNLSTTPPGTADPSLDRSRILSEFVPAPLQNVRPRLVTGPFTPFRETETAHGDSALHRELNFAKRWSVDQGKPNEVPTPAGEPALDVDGPMPTHITVVDGASRRTTRWRTIRRLGNGSFSDVVLAAKDSHPGSVDSGVAGLSQSPEPQQLVAVKIVTHDASARDEARMDTSIKREIDILQSLAHASLPRLLAYEDSASRALLVLSYSPGGDLFDFAYQHRELLSPQLIQRIFAELVSAVSYLHQHFIVHRDIKLENVLLNTSVNLLPADPGAYTSPLVTLTDLGLSKRIPPPPASPLLTHPCGSVDYAAPEVLLGQPYDGRATDAWALGVLLYALIEGRLPFDSLPSARRRGTNNVKHRIARCDWMWVEYGDEYGEWSETAPLSRELRPAKFVVEGLLKKAGRGRLSVAGNLAGLDWVREGISVDAGLRLKGE